MGQQAGIREAAVAGLFYPREREALRSGVEGMLAIAAAHQSPVPGMLPKALLVPHAGYVYSGPVAASAYALLRPMRGRVRRVVLLGPAHRVAVAGLALPGASAFQTPLGTVPVDREAVELLQRYAQVVISPAVHALEHSLEVQLPFLQMALGEFQLVPLAVGQASPEEVAEVLEALWGGPETLVVVSSDLSHYLPYKLAQQVDRGTCECILHLHQLHGHDQACGATPLNGLLLAAGQHRLAPRLLDARNSGDTAGDRDRVVGYAAFAFSEEEPGGH